MSKRRELEAQKQAEERKRMITMAVIIAALAIVIIGGAVILSNSVGGTLSQPSTSSRVFPPAKAAADLTPPANVDDKAFAWGPADAPVKIVEFLDYQCPHCGNYAKNFEPAVVAALAPSGKVRYELRPLSFLDRGTNESRDAGQAAMCAADQGKFWQMHKTIFANQLITGEENTGNFSKSRLKEMAGTIQGIDTATFGSCLDSDKYASQIATNMNDATTQKVDSTPTFFINGKALKGGQTIDDFKKAIAENAPGVTIP